MQSRRHHHKRTEVVRIHILSIRHTLPSRFPIIIMAGTRVTRSCGSRMIQIVPLAVLPDKRESHMQSTVIRCLRVQSSFSFRQTNCITVLIVLFAFTRCRILRPSQEFITRLNTWSLHRYMRICSGRILIRNGIA